MEDLYRLDPEQLEKRLLDKVGDGTWPPVHRAAALAKEKHAGQQRKDGSDFVGHPMRTALLLLEVGGVQDPNMLCAALLHDVVEDTDLSCDDLLGEFGSKVSDLVRALTLEPYQEGEDKSARDVAHFEHLAWEGRDPQLLRTADRLDNIRTLSADMPAERREAYLRDTRKHLLPLTLASNTGLYHALNLALADQGCPE
jgi:(p)ppGpp synthase/HD superfamily hydrolase